MVGGGGVGGLGGVGGGLIGWWFLFWVFDLGGVLGCFGV